MRTTYLSAAMIGLSLTSCGRATPISETSYRDHTAVVRGRIDGDLLRFFKTIPHGDLRNLVITSPGGETSTALKIVELLGAGSFDVTVRDYCASACASILVAAAKNRRLEKGALLLFHGSDVATVQLAQQSSIAKDLVWPGIDRANSQGELQIYAKRKINASIFKLISWRRKPMCVLDADGLGPEKYAAIVYRWNAYVPSPRLLARYGFKVSGTELTTIEQSARLKEIERELNHKISLNDDGADSDYLLSPQEVDRRFDALQLTLCDDQLTRKLMQGS